MIITSNEYYSNSGIICVPGGNAGAMTTVADASASGSAIDKAKYGTVWGAWPYKKTNATAADYLRS